MAVQWFDAPDYNPSVAAQPYENQANPSYIDVVSGAGGNWWRFNTHVLGWGYLVKNLSGNHAGFWVGMRIVFNTLNLCGFMALCDNGAAQLMFGVDSAGHLFAAPGRLGGTPAPTPLKSSVAQVVPGTTYFLEFKHIINNTTGSFQIWMNGVSVASMTNVDTQYTANATANQLAFGSLGYQGAGSPSFSIRDIYCLDTTGGAPWNARLGDCSAYTFMPTGPGSFAQFLPSTGANWSNADNNPPTADHNSSSTVGQRDSFVHTALTEQLAPSAGTIIAVKRMAYVQAESAGSSAIALTARQGGIDSVGANISQSGPGYVYACDIMPKDVNALNWTLTNLNATEFGYKKTV